MGSLVGGGPALGTAARCRDFRCSGRGGALSPPAARGRRRFCRGRPMCRPGHVPSRDPSAGGHIGPSLREVGRRSGTNGYWRETTPSPTGRDGARPLRGDREWTDGGVRLGSGGVRSPRPTGATLVVPSNGPMYLGHGRRRPNSVPKFGALVIGIGPYGDGGRHAGSSCPTGAESGRFWGNCETFPKHRRSKSAKKTEFVQKTGEFRWTFPARWCTIRRSMR